MSTLQKVFEFLTTDFEYSLKTINDPCFGLDQDHYILVFVHEKAEKQIEIVSKKGGRILDYGYEG